MYAAKAIDECNLIWYLQWGIQMQQFKVQDIHSTDTLYNSTVCFYHVTTRLEWIYYPSVDSL